MKGNNYTTIVLILLLLLVFPFRVYGITVEEEKKYGREMYFQIARAVPINNDLYISFYLHSMQERLEAATSLELPIVFTVIDSPTVDAFASIGGYVFITTGLISLCDKEEELAGVMAHEFAHISKRHVAKAIEKQKFMTWTTLATMLAAALIPSPAGKSAVLSAGLGGAQQMAITYTRENEEEADEVGSANADKAGYGGLGTAEFLKKLRITSDNKMVPRYLLTHPHHGERIVKIGNRWRNSTVKLDTSFFPYVTARAQILYRTPGLGIEEIWMNKYLRDNTDPVNCYAAALIYSMRGDTDESVRVASGIKSPYRDIFLGEMLVNARRYKEATDLLRYESNPIGCYFLAKAYEGGGDRPMAVKAYKEILSYANIYPELYSRLGMLCGMMGNEGDGYRFLGSYHLVLGNVDQARTNFEKAVNRYGINSKGGQEVVNLLDRLPSKNKK
ncbi:MAG: M48 family metalloprotease [Syntrophobacterales bacterium]|jgi:predicted Zn-dependent protease|nr:M48 family metalloprotease [Syntrophobacterales bacterium]